MSSLSSFSTSFQNKETVIRYENKIHEMKGCKVAGFDLDDTLTSTNLIPYPGVINKLNMLIKEGYNIVIISNQKKRHIGDTKLLVKLEKIGNILGIPFIAFCARAEDEFRKPQTSILSLIPDFLGKMEFFVGDAAGRLGDHSDCDKMFAKNSNIQFYTENEYFADFITNQFIREVLPECLYNEKFENKVNIQFLTLVIMIGYPGSGKTTWCKKMLPEYSYISRDIFKDMKKCVVKCKQELQKGNSIVVDNTNYTIEMREKFISIANEEDAQCVAIHINTSMKQSQVWNDTRGELRVPTIVYYKYKKKFEEPTIEEGFDHIIVKE